jgi:thiol:disulfide interchange protein
MHYLKFKAKWCNPCKRLDKILQDLKVSDVLEIDIESPNEDHQMFVQTFNVQSVPTMIKINSQGKETERLEGLVSIDRIKKFFGVD